MIPAFIENEIAQIPARVDAGVELLDKFDPGWHEKIDTSKLNITNCRNCVLGQWANDYAAGLLNLPECGWKTQFDHGFERFFIRYSHGMVGEAEARGCIAYQNLLESEWVRRINERIHNPAGANS